MLSIGEFSRVSNLTVKTIRYYHDAGILLPGKIDDMTGYRYYGEDASARAETIGVLKSLGFSINEIKRIFEDCTTDEDLSVFISEKILNVENQIKDLQNRKKKLDQYRSITTSSDTDYCEIQENRYGGFWICGIRYTGLYSEMGQYYKKIFKSCGAFVKGKSQAFYYDMEYKEKNADIEAVIPLMKEVKIKGMNCRIFEEKRSLSLIHKGAYGTQGESYLKLFSYCREKGFTIQTPLIERYLRGPGLFFKGREDKYLTEIIVIIE